MCYRVVFLVPAQHRRPVLQLVHDLALHVKLHAASPATTTPSVPTDVADLFHRSPDTVVLVVLQEPAAVVEGMRALARINKERVAQATRRYISTPMATPVTRTAMDVLSFKAPVKLIENDIPPRATDTAKMDPDALKAYEDCYATLQIIWNRGNIFSYNELATWCATIPPTGDPPTVYTNTIFPAPITEEVYNNTRKHVVHAIGVVRDAMKTLSTQFRANHLTDVRSYIRVLANLMQLRHENLLRGLEKGTIIHSQLHATDVEFIKFCLQEHRLDPVFTTRRATS